LREKKMYEDGKIAAASMNKNERLKQPLHYMRPVHSNLRSSRPSNLIPLHVTIPANLTLCNPLLCAKKSISEQFLIICSISIAAAVLSFI
uniref:Ovule protein n=1 Tax=Gongylonema pulchrum TaxID=637853 RepID=A0A183DKH7_9BILA